MEVTVTPNDLKFRAEAQVMSLLLTFFSNKAEALAKLLWDSYTQTAREWKVFGRVDEEWAQVDQMTRSFFEVVASRMLLAAEGYQAKPTAGTTGPASSEDPSLPGSHPTSGT